MTLYRVKLRVKVPGEKATDRRRRLVCDLIEKHGGKDVSAKRPGALFAAAVFRDNAAAKAFRQEAKAALGQQ